MKTKLRTFCFITLIAASLPLQSQAAIGESATTDSSCYRGSRTPASVIDYNDIAIPMRNNVSLKPEQVKQAIVEAGKAKGWTVSTVSDGKLLASIMIRGKHHVAVEIPYSADKYSIRYKQSANMNYAQCNGKAYIHPNYNVWVGRLHHAIQARLGE